MSWPPVLPGYLVSDGGIDPEHGAGSIVLVRRRDGMSARLGGLNPVAPSRATTQAINAIFKLIDLGAIGANMGVGPYGTVGDMVTFGPGEECVAPQPGEMHFRVLGRVAALPSLPTDV